MPVAAMRALLGFVAAAVSVLTFHQAMWALLHFLAIPGMGMPPPYPMQPVRPWGVPRLFDLCFWGGLYGVVFGLVLPRLKGPLWLCGLGLGIIAGLVGIFIVPAIKGLPVGAGWAPRTWLLIFLINGFWGIGVGIILPLLLRQTRRRA
jgi:hypothetical protein